MIAETYMWRLRMSTVGERIRLLRKKKGLSLRELAGMCGDMSHSTIGHIETGLQEGTLKKIRAIADALGVSVGLLIEPDISLDRIDQISDILDRIDQLDDASLEAVDRMIDALAQK